MRVVDSDDRQLDRELRSIRPMAARVDVTAEQMRLTGGEIPGHSGAMCGAEIRWYDEFDHRLAKDIRPWIAEDALGRRIVLEHSAFLINRDDAVDRGLDHPRAQLPRGALAIECPAPG